MAAIPRSQVLLYLTTLKKNVKLNNFCVFTKMLYHPTDGTRSYTTENVTKMSEEKNVQQTEKISTAMKIYLERAKQYDEFLQNEKHEFEKGKRHLANMMGYDYDKLTEEDIDKSIEYLFPSGLYDKRARPMMKPPDIIHPPRKAAQFDKFGRPYNSLFYTCKPNYYQALYDIVEKMEDLNSLEDKMIIRGKKPVPEDAIDLIGSIWMSKLHLEKLLCEEINDQEYEYFIATLNRLTDHPYSNSIKEFIIKYRKVLVSLTKNIVLLPIEYNSEGRPFVHVKNCVRKSTRGEVILWANGSGKITINGKDITYFNDFQSREQQCN